MSDQKFESQQNVTTAKVELDGIGYRAKVMHRGKVVAEAWFDSQDEAEEFNRVEVLKDHAA